MILKSLRITRLVLLLGLSATMTVHARNGSQEISAGAASIAISPLASLKGEPIAASTFFVAGSVYIITGVVGTASNLVEIVIENTINGSKAVFKVTASIARELGVSVGTAVRFIAEGTGYSLVASGKILAFIPNEIGQALLHQSKLSN